MARSGALQEVVDNDTSGSSTCDRFTSATPAVKGQGVTVLHPLGIERTKELLEAECNR